MQLISPSKMCQCDGSGLNHSLISLDESHDFVLTVLTAGHQDAETAFLTAYWQMTCSSVSSLVPKFSQGVLKTYEYPYSFSYWNANLLTFSYKLC